MVLKNRKIKNKKTEDPGVPNTPGPGARETIPKPGQRNQ